MIKLPELKNTLALAGITALGVTLAGPVQADWTPKGPMTLMIAFAAGGGADTQARLIAADIQKQKGWKIIPQNVTGKGGAVLARKLKGEPNDGLTIGIAVTETVGYNMLAAKNPGYGHKDFTYVTTTAGSQMAIYANASKGWKSWEDVVKASKGGGGLKFGVMSARLSDIAFLLGQKSGIKVNPVVLRGGRAVLNAVTGGDVDVGFGAGIQNKSVKSGTAVHLVSAENGRLKLSPDVPTLREMGIPFDGGGKFLIFGPKGMPAEAVKEIAGAFASVLKDKSSKAAQFVSRAFGGPQLISGTALTKLIDDGIANSQKLMEAASK